ncbi:MAG: hypothetical protein RL030_14 [Pseudomonadota bacterium]
MDAHQILATGLAALLFALVFVFGRSARPISRLFHGRRGVVSFGAGASAAYMFVHVMPELHGTREVISDANPKLPWEGMAVYFVALTGFLVFYALGHARHSTKGEGDGEVGEGAGRARYHLQLGGFAVYVWLLGYLLVRSFDDTGTSVVLFAIAIAFHLLSIDRSLSREYVAPYEQRGRYVLALMGPLGWAVGMLVRIPDVATALLVAFISGAVIVNTAVTEMPKEGGRLVPFVLGGIIYGLILIPFG